MNATASLPSRGEGSAAPSLALQPGQASESRLIAALRSRRDGAMEELMKLHEAAIRRRVRHLVSDPYLVEDVLQETWLAVLSGIDRFEGRSSLRTWLLRIAKNRAISRRGAARRARSFADLSWPAGREEEALGDGAVADGEGALSGSALPSPDHGALVADDVHRVHEKLTALPSRQRRVLILRDIEDRSSLEVREEMGLSEGNQRVLLHRARTRLREALPLLDEAV